MLFIKKNVKVIWINELIINFNVVIFGDIRFIGSLNYCFVVYIYFFKI